MIGTALLSVILYAAMGLIMNMCLDASAKIGSALMKSVYELFFNDTGTVYNAGLKILFPTPGFNLGDFIVKVSFAIMGLCIVVGCVKSMAAPVTGEEAESPISIVGHAVIGTLLMLLFFGNPTVFFSRLQVSPDGTLNIIQIVLNAIKQGFDSMGLEDLMTTNWTLTSLSWSFVNPGDYLLGLVLCGTLIVMVVRAAISSLERILSFCAFVALGPFYFAFYPLKETRNYAKEWIMGLFAQTVAMFLSMMMWVAFVYRFNNMTIGADITSSILDFTICIVILTICEKSEQMLNAVGLRTLPNSDAARQAFLGSGLASGVAHLASKSANGLNNFLGNMRANGFKSAAATAFLGSAAGKKAPQTAPKTMQDAALGAAGTRNANMAAPAGGSATAAKASAASMMNGGGDMKAAYNQLMNGGNTSKRAAAAAVGNAESSRIDKFANMNPDNGQVFADANAMKAAGASDLEANAAMQIKNYANSSDMKNLANTNPAEFNRKMSAYSDSVKAQAVQSGLGSDITGRDFAFNNGTYSAADASKAEAASMLEQGGSMSDAYNGLASQGTISNREAVAAVADAESSRIDGFANMDSANGPVFADANAMKAAGASYQEAGAAMQIKNFANSPEMQELAKSDPGAYADKMSAYSDSVKTAAVQSGLGSDVVGDNFGFNNGASTTGLALGVNDAGARMEADSMMNRGSDMSGAYDNLVSNGGVSREMAVAAVGNAESSRIDGFANTDTSSGPVYADYQAMRSAGASEAEATSAMLIKSYASTPEMQELAKSDPGAYASKMSEYSDSIKTDTVRNGLGEDIAGQTFAVHGGSAVVDTDPGISNAVFDGKHEFTVDSGVNDNDLRFTRDALGSGNFGVDVVQDATMDFGFGTGSDGKAYARHFDTDSMSMADVNSMSLADRWNKVADSFENNDGACDASYVAHVMGLNNADNVIGTARLCQTEDGSGAAIVMQDKTLGTFAITNGRVEDGSALTYVSGSGSEEKTFDTGYTVNVASGSNVAVCKPQPAANGEQFSQSDKFKELLSLDTPMASGKDADQDKSMLKALYNAAKDARIKKKM